MDNQVVELLGRNRLVGELLAAEIEVAIPLRDRGVDLVAYIEEDPNQPRFISFPVQMKAARRASFVIESKYHRINNLILAYVWHLDRPDQATSYALTYQEALSVADQMGYTATPCWQQSGKYSTSHPSRELRELLSEYEMTPETWRTKLYHVAGIP